MKVAIIGSRTINNYKMFKEQITEVISGGAAGVDTMASKWAAENNIPITVFKADWKNLNAVPCKIKENKFGKYNALAGMNRNKLVIDIAEKVIAFWDC